MRSLSPVLPPVALVAGMLLLTSCATSAVATGPSTAAPDDGLTVVATTTVLGDVVGDLVACAGGSVVTIMPVGADPHDFSPSSEQVGQMVSADLVVANGLGLEAGLSEALTNAANDGATVMELAPLIDPIEFGAHADDTAAPADEEEHGSLDPHFWFDMERMATAVELVADQLGTTTGDTRTFADCGARVADEIRATDEEVRATLESVPADRRILVTDHEALGYLAARYGYEVVGTVIPAGTTLAEPSSEDLANLAGLIRDLGVSAIFANAAQPSKLADAVAEESGAEISVVPLFVESLGEPGSGADTYLGLMTTDAELIANALT